MPQLVATQAALDDVLARLRDAPALAVDTESDAYFAYRPRICLFQVSMPGADYLIDPLADMDLAGFGALLADPARRVVLHAAENDVIQMRHEYGWQIANLFDTQIAVFVLGLKPYSLAGVLEARFGVKLDKSEQRSDWSQRPLSERQKEYAAKDTHYLLELADELGTKAEEAGRTEEIAAECHRIAQREWEPAPFDPEGFRRINGSKELDPTRLRILRSLYLLRHEEAERRNRAAYRVVSDQALMTIARSKATSARKGIPQSFWNRYGRRVVGLVQAAEGKGPLPRPPRKTQRTQPPPPAVKERFERLRKWRGRAAEKRGVEPWVVARNDLLWKIAESGAQDADGLTGIVEPFRLREYGADIAALLVAKR